MNPLRHFSVLLLASALACASASVCRGEQHKKTKLETGDISDVVEHVNELLKAMSAAEILVVLDIDNTLLAMNQDLGSDQWFGWQDELRKQYNESPDNDIPLGLVANSFPRLLRVQGILYSVSAMHPPKPNIPDMVESIQNRGVTTVVLTSRGPEFRDATERELRRNRYDFARSQLKIVEPLRGHFLPFDYANPDKAGLTDEISNMLGKPRPVSYSNGIYMTAGQHKGYMLKTLIARSVDENNAPRKFKAIVFVDDHIKHTNRMHEAYAADQITLTTFRHSREDGNVANFNDSNKKHVIRAWRRFKRGMDEALIPETKEAFILQQEP